MIKIIGILVVLGCVLGGFILSGGKFMALVHPFEVMIIGGAALGAFLQGSLSVFGLLLALLELGIALMVFAGLGGMLRKDSWNEYRRYS